MREKIASVGLIASMLLGVLGTAFGIYAITITNTTQNRQVACDLPVYQLSKTEDAYYTHPPSSQHSRADKVIIVGLEHGDICTGVLSYRLPTINYSVATFSCNAYSYQDYTIHIPITFVVTLNGSVSSEYVTTFIKTFDIGTDCTYFSFTISNLPIKSASYYLVALKISIERIDVGIVMNEKDNSTIRWSTCP